jgi:hypothetical protein
VGGGIDRSRFDVLATHLCTLWHQPDSSINRRFLVRPFAVPPLTSSFIAVSSHVSRVFHRVKLLEGCINLTGPSVRRSVETIDPNLSSPGLAVPHYSAQPIPTFARKPIASCLLTLINVFNIKALQKLFAVTRASQFWEESFMLNSPVITLVCESQSRFDNPHSLCFRSCEILCYVQMPKSVRAICEHCFEGCLRISCSGSQDRVVCILILLSFGLLLQFSFWEILSFATVTNYHHWNLATLPASHLTNISDRLFQHCHILEIFNLTNFVTKTAVLPLLTRVSFVSVVPMLESLIIRLDTALLFARLESLHSTVPIHPWICVLKRDSWGSKPALLNDLTGRKLALSQYHSKSLRDLFIKETAFESRLKDATHWKHELLCHLFRISVTVALRTARTWQPSHASLSVLSADDFKECLFFASTEVGFRQVLKEVGVWF